ncbi:ferric reductase like transmembrane component [Xylariaceae sp. FL0255]|nr:ferric reductase like transmembrane component [Xylariaceae sp. FL0255]
MSWPYQFIDLDEAQSHARRLSLDRHGLIAQLSALVPVAVVLAYRGYRWATLKVVASEGGEYAAVPSSPGAKELRLSRTGKWEIRARKLIWWLGDEIVFLGTSWGTRDQMVGGAAWFLWLLFLCTQGTGVDYMHFTKRFGIVGVSQFPVQYLLSLKYLNPIAWALGSSHEDVNRWHRVLGRIIYVLLFAHAILYLNFYYQKGLLAAKLVSRVPVLGLTAITGMHALSGTAFQIVRQYSYRVFFITHLIVALALPPIIYFHTHHAKVYVWEAFIVFVLDIASRKIFKTVVAESKVEFISGTDLIKVVGRIPVAKIGRFVRNPGTHVYMSIPAGSRPNKNPVSAAHLIFDFVFNPFSVASVDESTGDLTLVARHHNGPMTNAFASFANNSSGSEQHVKLAFDGPYGCASRFPNLSGPEFDRILLVAGGVGATFTLPLYRWIQTENPAARVQMVWAVRGAGDATWPVTEDGKSIIDDDNIKVFLTGDILDDSAEGDYGRTSSDVELESFTAAARRRGYASKGGNKRPNLQKIVDDVFRMGQEERVAVLVCGPEAMARDLRSHVGVWVQKGRKVWWHNEGFGW